MLRNATLGLAVVLGVLSFGTPLRAQYFPPVGPNYGPFGGPALNPYLNLIRGGDPAANYFLGVVPERYNRSAFRAILSGNAVGGPVRNLDIRDMGGPTDDLYPQPSPGASDLLVDALPGTGHPATFGNTAGYFGNTTGTRLRSPLTVMQSRLVGQRTPGQTQGTPRR